MPKKNREFSIQTAIEQGKSLYGLVTMRVFRGVVPYHMHTEEFQLPYYKWLEDVRLKVLPQHPEIESGLFDEERCRTVIGHLSHSFKEESQESRIMQRTNTYTVFLDLFLRQRDALKTIETKITVHLENGLAWRDPKTRFFYQFEPKSKRLLFLEILTGANGQYTKTEFLARKIHYNDTTLRKEKRALNTLFKEELGLPDFILGQKKFGYQINQKYSLKKVS